MARERHFTKIVVIAGVGVRRYYAKLGYVLQDTYMVKHLTNNECVNGDDKNSNVVQENQEENVVIDHNESLTVKEESQSANERHEKTSPH